MLRGWGIPIVIAVLSGAPAAAWAAPAAGGGPSLSFAQAVAMAARQNTNVAIAGLKLGEASAKVGQNRAPLLPSVTGQAETNERTYNLLSLGLGPLFPPSLMDLANPVLGPVYDSETRIRLSQTLFDYASWKKMRGAQLGVLGARADLGATAEGAAYGAALTYLKAARAAEVVSAREEDLRLATELASLAETQLSAGTSPAIDVTRARTQVASARGALLVARNQRDRAVLDLARSLGLDPAAPPTLTDSLDTSLGASDAPNDESAAIAFALDHRPELRSESARLARARVDRSAMTGERIPRVDVSADWGGSADHFGDQRETYTYAVAVTLPILDGLKREGRIKEQDDLVRESVVREKDLRDQIAADVEGALLDLGSGIEQQSVAAERLKLAEDELAQSRERFVSGVAGNIEVINAQSSLVKAHDADIDARFAVASARAALARAAGVAQTMH